MVISHGELLNNQMVNELSGYLGFFWVVWAGEFPMGVWKGVSNLFLVIWWNGDGDSDGDEWGFHQQK